MDGGGRWSGELKHSHPSSPSTDMTAYLDWTILTDVESMG
jgi:hypothetical protein